MITTVVLDIGNVLAHFRWKEYLEECGYDRDIKERVAKATVLCGFWNEWDRGARDEEELIAESIAKDPGVKQEILTFFQSFDKIVREYDYSREFVKTLKDNGYKVYLLSNYSKKHFELSKPTFSFLPYVDGAVISYEVKSIKPEPEIYQTLIDKYGINPYEAVFLDDLADNLEGAKPFGFHTIQVSNYEQARTELRELGVRI
jgi:putative hydrolase of the HAD superfamily